MTARRILGLIIIATAILGVVISILGIVAGRRAMDRLGDELDAGLTTATETLDNLDSTLELSQAAVETAIASMGTLEQTALDASKAISDTRPLITGVSELVTGDVADALESVQQTIVPLVDLSVTIDQALTALSQFKIEREILGVPITVDPGVEYDPEVSLPEAVNAVADSLVGIPAQLRALEGDLENADGNFGTIGQDLALIAGNIREIRTSLAELPVLIDGFQTNVSAAKAQIEAIQTGLSSNWQLIKTGMIIFFIWLGLTQIAPLMWGYEMLTERPIEETERLAEDERSAASS